MAGLALDGFTPKRQDEIRADLEALAKSPAYFGPSVDLDPDGPLGHFIGIFSEREALVWEKLQDVYDSFNVNNATGIPQDNLGQAVGVDREGATKGTGTLTLTGTPATVVTGGSQAKKSATGEEVATAADATIAATTAWVGATAYTVGDRRTNGGNVYICTVAGTSAASGGPTTETTGIVDGTVTWDFVGNGTGDVDIGAAAVDAGAFKALARSIDAITTPVAGWDSAINLTDFVPGQDQESHNDYRVRRKQSLQIIGAGTDGSIRAKLLKRDDVDLGIVFSNRSSTPFTIPPTSPPLPPIPGALDPVPAHSFLSVLYPATGADEDALATVVFENQPSGIEPFGDVSKVVTDDQGFSQVVAWAYATEVDIWVDVTVISTGPDYPVDAEDQIKAAILAYGDALSVGEDLIAIAIQCALTAVPGLLDFSVKFDAVASPTNTANIAIPFIFIARFDSSRITIS